MMQCVTPYHIASLMGAIKKFMYIACQICGDELWVDAFTEFYVEGQAEEVQSTYQCAKCLSEKIDEKSRIHTKDERRDG